MYTVLSAFVWRRDKLVHRILNGPNTTFKATAMKFDIANVVFVTACFVVTFGSQIQGKILVSLFSTPLLAAWAFSSFLAIIDVLRWVVGEGSGGERDGSKATRSALYVTILHMADITAFFIALNYASLWIIGLFQLSVLNFWQLFNSAERTPSFNRANILFGVGLVVFLVEVFRTHQPHWAIIQIGASAIHTYVNYYLHHYAQCYVESAHYLKAEMFASSTLVAVLAPFAWLEFNLVYLPDVNVSFTAVTLALTCVLGYGYRRCGIFFNSLTQPSRANFFIVAALFALLMSSVTLTALMVISFVLVSVAAYLSTGATAASQHNESKTKFSILVTLCTILLLAQGVVDVVSNANFIEQTALTPADYHRGLPPIAPDPEIELNRLVCIRKVRERVIKEVGSLLKAGEPIAYMDLPMHSNLGDVLIWQGTQHLLENYGQFPIVTDKFLDRNISVAKSLIKDGVFLLHGGGNFGDLWRDNANFRLKVAKEVKNNDIVFLPQSVHYTQKEYLEADNNTFQANHRLLLTFRDYPSLEFARKNFSGVPSKYIPDMAFAMGPQIPNGKPVIDIILLLRIDKENIILPHDKKTALQWLKSKRNITFEVWDFPVMGFPVKLLSDNKTVVYNYTQIYPKQWITLSPNNRHAFMGIRKQMVNNLFSRGRIIITDRLHASIMSTLMGKPVIYLDNFYKKIANVRGALAKEFEECSDTNLRARHTNTLIEAVKLADKIINGQEKI